MKQIEKMEDNFQNYLMCMSDDLAYLCRMVESFHGQDDICDYSLESLTFVEAFLDSQLDEHTIEIFDRHKLIEVVSTYMGEIVRKKMNGKWDLCRDEIDIDYSYPMVCDLDGLPDDFGWSPIQNVFHYRDVRKQGFLVTCTDGVLDPY